MSPDLYDRFLTHVKTTGLFHPPGLALLAVSGGSDSVTMLDLMATVAPDLQLELAVAHVDHGIAPESAEVAQQVAARAHCYGFRYHGTMLQLGPETSETRARRERYRALRTIQREAHARYLVTAHHADDQVETVLYRLLRGSGIAGLAGIPARGPGGLVRPLLPFTRAELEQWREHQAGSRGAEIPVYRDPANIDDRHDRSWVRHRLLPTLEQRFGARVRRYLLDVARHASGDRAAWAALLRELPQLKFRAENGAVEVARAPFQRYDNVLSEALLRALAREVGCSLGPRRAARVLRFVRVSSSGHSVQLGGGWVAEIAFDKVRIVPASSTVGDIDAVPLVAETGGSGRVNWGTWQITWCSEPAGETVRAAHTTWITPGTNELRAVAPGDRLVPLGGVGHRRVRRLLMEARVPARDRDAYPVLVRDDSVLWVPGICRAETAVPQPGEPAVRIDARSGGDR